MKNAREDLFVRLLYGGPLGRAVLKLVISPRISKIAGDFLNSKPSRALIAPFCRKNKITLEDVVVPEGGFSSFNEFFYRRRREKQGDVLKKTASAKTLISPCDGYLSVIPITESVMFSIKHTWFSIYDLLADRELSEEFSDGYALVFRLTPSHYHRYCYCANGRVSKEKKISGKLHCVRPIATEKYPVFAQNQREYQVLDTAFGRVVQMEIGALLVGKITNRNTGVGELVFAGEEKGYFEFGGSTIVVLVKKDSLSGNRDIKNRRISTGEYEVRQMDVIGHARRR